MADRKPKQSPDNILRFNELLKGYLNTKGKSPSWLAHRTHLSTTTITRMVNNTDYRGSYYQPTEKSVVLVCAALGLNSKQSWEMYNLAFPERAIFIDALNNGDSVNEIWNALETMDKRKN